MRVGMGYDVHKLVEGRPLILGGVEIPHTLGLLGHSDADVLLHAIMDALLGAAGLGDIGKHFPDTDPQYKGISSMKLLSHVAELIREKALRNLNDEIPHGVAVAIDRMKERPGGTLIDIDATIVCERNSHKGIIIGKQGSMLKKIGTDARRDIEALLDCKVNLKLWVKVKKDWRDSDFLIKNFGYRSEGQEE